MITDGLKGLFVIGTIKTGVQFLGVVYDIDDKYLYLDYKDAKKFILISEIAELKAEAVRGNKNE